MGIIANPLTSNKASTAKRYPVLEYRILCANGDFDVVAEPFSKRGRLTVDNVKLHHCFDAVRHAIQQQGDVVVISSGGKLLASFRASRLPKKLLLTDISLASNELATQLKRAIHSL